MMTGWKKVSSGQTRKIEVLLDRFDEEWAAGRAPRIEDFLEGLGDDLPEVLVDLIEFRHNARRQP